MAYNLSQMTSKNGYNITELISAVQKCIRRNLEREALFFAHELYKSGFSEWLWKRLIVITSEDVGLAEPNMPMVINALYENAKIIAPKKDQKNRMDDIPLMHAVILLCRAKKSRLVDNAKIWANNTNWRPDIPDFAIDAHTDRGRKAGKNLKDFFTTGAWLENKSNIPDEYQQWAYRHYIGEWPDNTDSVFLTGDEKVVENTLEYIEQIERSKDQVSTDLFNQ